MNYASAINLECIKSTPSKNGGFITKLQTKEERTTETPFGVITASSQLTFYTKTKTVVVVGTKGAMPMDQFDVVERDYTINDAASDLNGETIKCKWLYPKGQAPQA